MPNVKLFHIIYICCKNVSNMIYCPHSIHIFMTGGFYAVARRKRNKMNAIGVSLHPKTIRELSTLSDVLDMGVSEIAREMILNDLPRFKERHRQELKEAKVQHA